jgi:Zn-dependent peptidase ImmA (M78 family)
MVRYPYIHNEVLKLYKSVGRVVFPIEPLDLFKQIKNCKIMTYQQFAALNKYTLKDVIELCESNSGCTHYYVDTNRYLTLYNASPAGNNVAGRIRWTKAHELGHIFLKHLPYLAVSKIAEHNFNSIHCPELEKEADHFAAMLLSPFPVWGALDIKTPLDVQRVFGLSEEASVNRVSSYAKWRQTRIKTAWENDMVRLVMGGM